MSVQIVETHVIDSALAGALSTPLLNTDKVRALLLNLAGGQAVAPCQMSVTVLYYIVEGQGHLDVEDEQAELRAGSLAVVPAGATRSISADERMRVLAVQML